MAAPAFAETRRREQAFDQTLKGIGPRISQEDVDLFRSRRQAAKIDAQPADQGLAAGFAPRTQRLGLEACVDEAVDGILDRLAAALEPGQRRTSNGLIRPVSALLLAGPRNGGEEKAGDQSDTAECFAANRGS